MKTIKAFDDAYYAAKWGISDLYTDCRQALEEAIGKPDDFTTGWFGAKKEIEYGRITREDGVYLIQASVSDDFDTMGEGSVKLNDLGGPPARIADRLMEALDGALGEARANQIENRVYNGWAIGKAGGDGKRANWVETYISPRGWGFELEEPPGDYYYAWGWQDDGDDVPKDVRDYFEEKIREGDEMDVTFSFQGWVCERWAD